MGGCSSKPQTAEHDGAMEAPLERLEEDQGPEVAAVSGNEGFKHAAALNSTSSFKTTLQESKSTLKSLFLQQEKDDDEVVRSFPKLHELLDHPLSAGKAGQKKPETNVDSLVKTRELQTEVNEDKERAKNSEAMETSSKTKGTISDLMSADLNPTVVDAKVKLSSGDDATDDKRVECADVLKHAVNVKDGHAEAIKAAVNDIPGHAESLTCINNNSNDHAEGLQPVLNNIGGHADSLKSVDNYSSAHVENKNSAAVGEFKTCVIDPVETKLESSPIGQMSVKNVDDTVSSSSPIDHIKTVVQGTYLTETEQIKPVTEQETRVASESVYTVSSHVDRVELVKEVTNPCEENAHTIDEENANVSDDQVSQIDHKASDQDLVSGVTVIQPEDLNVAAAVIAESNPTYPQVTPSDESVGRDFCPVLEVEPIPVSLTNDSQNVLSPENIKADDHVSSEAEIVSPPSPIEYHTLPNAVRKDSVNHVNFSLDPITAETTNMPEDVPGSFIEYSAAINSTVEPISEEHITATRENNKKIIISESMTATKEDKQINETDIRTEEEVASGGTVIAVEHENSQSTVATKSHGTVSDCTGNEPVSHEIEIDQATADEKLVDAIPDQSEPEHPIIEGAAVDKSDKPDLVEAHSVHNEVTIVETIPTNENVEQKIGEYADDTKPVHGETDKAVSETANQETASGSIKEEAGECERIANIDLRDGKTTHSIGDGDEVQTSVEALKSEDKFIAPVEKENINETATGTPCLTAESKQNEPVLVGNAELEMKLTEDNAMIEAPGAVDADKKSTIIIDGESETYNLKPLH